MNNHPLSKLPQSPDIEKEKMQNTVSENELIFTISLLTQEVNRLSNAIGGAKADSVQSPMLEKKV